MLYNIFPLQICRASLKYNLYCNITDEELLSSFFEHLHERESLYIQKLIDGKTIEVQPIVDIFSEYGIFDRPTVKNIRELCIKAANVCLIRLPLFSIQSITANEQSTHEQEIITWLHRYLRICTNEELLLFVRFVTGLTSFPPKSIIQL